MKAILRISLVVLCVAPPILAVQQARDAVRPAEPAKRTGTATLSGIVLGGGDTPAPLRRVTVTISEQIGGGGPSVVTEADGRFSFSGLPAGRYFVTATKAAYLTTAYGATRPSRSGAPPTGTAIALADGQAIADLRLTMLRGGVITGVVRGHGGEPARGALVQASYFRRDAAGLRTLVASRSDVTDGRGGFRIFGLAPGEYVVAAQWPFSTISDLEVTRDADLSLAARLARPAATASPPPAPPVNRPRLGAAPTFYPGVIGPADAATIRLAPGDEKAGVDIRLELAANSRANGRVIDESGQPVANVTVAISTASGSEATSPFNTRALSGPDGSFSLRGIPPGPYTIQVVAGATSPGAGPSWARTEITGGGADIEGLTLTVRPVPWLTGRVRAEGGATPLDMSRVRVLLSQPGANTPVTPAGDGTFRAPVVPGRFRLAVQIAPSAGRVDWMATSAMFGGADVLDAGLEIIPGTSPSELLIDLTNQVPEISGSLTDSAGRPAPEYFVIVFPSDRALWTWGSSRIRQLRPGSDGRFAFVALPPGEYQIGAVTDVEENQWFETAFLEQLLAASVKVRLAPGQKLVQDLRVK